MKYRIVRASHPAVGGLSGGDFFMPQQRVFWLFWSDMRISWCARLQDAQDVIDREIWHKQEHRTVIPYEGKNP